MAPVHVMMAVGLFLPRQAASAPAEPPRHRAPVVEEYLIKGRLAEGERVMKELVKKQPDSAEARFGLGVLQFLRGVERLMPILGLNAPGPQSTPLPFLSQLRIPLNPSPNQKPVSAESLRKVLERWGEDLAIAEHTLSEVRDGPIKLPLHLGQMRLDMNGDGKIDAGETVLRLYETFAPVGTYSSKDAEEFLICFDAADVHWLRAYCHLLMAINDVMLAYDWTELFNRTGHLLFAKVDTPYGFLSTRSNGPFDVGEISDLIACIHLMSFPLKEPSRMPSALAHFESMIAQSRQMYKLALLEEDNDHEWIPNPNQTSVLSGIHVSSEMMLAWGRFLNELESLLSGKKLIPFWRGNDGRGVNLRRVFTEPRRFDLVLWVQGTDAVPYLEPGDLESWRTWEEFQRVFGGNFVGFVIWFN